MDLTIGTYRCCYVDLPDGIKGKARPRFNRKTGTAYNTQATIAAEDAIRDAWVAVNGDKMAGYAGAVCLDICFAREVPKREPRKNIGRPYLKRPDVDNVAKLVMDALTGVAWKDDVQVCTLEVLRCSQGAPGSRAWMSIRVVYTEGGYE